MYGSGMESIRVYVPTGKSLAIIRLAVTCIVRNSQKVFQCIKKILMIVTKSDILLVINRQIAF